MHGGDDALVPAAPDRERFGPAPRIVSEDARDVGDRCGAFRPDEVRLDAVTHLRQRRRERETEERRAPANEGTRTIYRASANRLAPKARVSAEIGDACPCRFAPAFWDRSDGF